MNPIFFILSFVLLFVGFSCKNHSVLNSRLTAVINDSNQLSLSWKIPHKTSEKFMIFRIKRQYVTSAKADTLPMDFSKCSPLFTGTIKSIDGFFHFNDSSSEEGTTYAYLVVSKGKLFRDSCIVRHRRSDIWWNYQVVENKIAAMKNTFNEIVTIDTIGYTCEGKAIKAIKTGKGTKNILLIGAIHAGESGPEIIIPVISSLLREGFPLTKVKIIAIPLINADSREKIARGYPNYIRTNANGVDLNRNFSYFWDSVSFDYGARTDQQETSTYRGEKPFSEPESKALKNFIEQHPPQVVFSFHYLNSASCYPMNYSINVCRWNDWHKRDSLYENKCILFADLYGKAYDGSQNQEKVKYHRPSIHPGTLEAWVYKTYNVPAFAMEGGIDSITIRAKNDELTTEYMQEHVNRHINAIKAVINKISHEN